MAKILIVEDDQDVVETYTDLLETKGHTIQSVMRASEAILVVSRYRPDVIILDLNLPGDSGTSVVSFVRGYPTVANTKIIVASGHPEMLKRSGYVAYGVDAILPKPVSNQTLLETIDAFIAKLPA
jgi:CheY-like chemotaxis protein